MHCVSCGVCFAATHTAMPPLFFAPIVRVASGCPIVRVGCDAPIVWV